jgi:hypothetical protein
MTISSISSNDYYSGLTRTNTQNSSRGRGHLSKALDSLQNALDSGDTSTAQSVLSDLLSHAPQSSPAGGSSSPAEKITDTLKQIQSALASGDTSSAQSALTSLKDSLPKNRGPMGAGEAMPEGGAQPPDPLSKALDSLQNALDSGDTSTAQSVLTNLLAHAPKSSSTDTDTTSTDSSTSSNPADKITGFFKQLKRALTSGDTSSAQSVVSSLKDYLASNPLRPPSSVGMYSTDGSLASGYSSSNQSVNLFA